MWRLWAKCPTAWAIMALFVCVKFFVLFFTEEDVVQFSKILIVAADALFLRLYKLWLIPITT